MEFWKKWWKFGFREIWKKIVGNFPNFVAVCIDFWKIIGILLEMMKIRFRRNLESILGEFWFFFVEDNVVVFGGIISERLRSFDELKYAARWWFCNKAMRRTKVQAGRKETTYRSHSSLELSYNSLLHLTASIAGQIQTSHSLSLSLSFIFSVVPSAT